MKWTNDRLWTDAVIVGFGSPLFVSYILEPGLQYVVSWDSSTNSARFFRPFNAESFCFHYVSIH